MRKGFASLSLQVQEILRRDPLSGQLFCFRGRRGDLLKVIWHDGQGACLFTKREFEPLPSNLAAAHAMILAERNARVMAEANAAVVKAEAANAQADLSSSEALNAHLKLEIEKLRRELYGSRSERKARLLEQMELQLEDLETAATEDELAAETAAVRTQTVQSFQRKRPSRKPFPDHLPRERIVIAAPESCPCCGSAKLSKLGEDITETLEVIPRRWKVIQTVREKFSCRECEKITQPPAPFHVTPRGFAGPNLLAMILFEKFGQHQPLNRQSERYRREGVDLRSAPAQRPCNRFMR
jgi:transposase